MDEIDTKLARLSGRVQARRDELRRQLETAPELASLLEAWKATFGPLRVTHVRIGEYQHGEPPERGIVPAPYHPPRRARLGKAAALRERERLGR